MDLTKNFPRSPYAKLGRYTWLPRIIDKAKAHASGTIGEYKYQCPMDAAFLEFWGLSSETFLAQVTSKNSDEEILAWVKERTLNRTDDEVRQFELKLLDTPPLDSDKAAYLKTYQESVAPGRSDLNTFAKVIAVEEGHPIPVLVR